VITKAAAPPGAGNVVLTKLPLCTEPEIRCHLETIRQRMHLHAASRVKEPAKGLHRRGLRRAAPAQHACPRLATISTQHVSETAQVSLCGQRQHWKFPETFCTEICVLGLEPISLRHAPKCRSTQVIQLNSFEAVYYPQAVSAAGGGQPHLLGQHARRPALLLSPPQLRCAMFLSSCR